MRIDTSALVSVSEASRRGVSWLVNEAAEGRTPVVLSHNRPVAAVVGLETMERLQRLDEMESDLRLWVATIVREASDNGTRHSLVDVAAVLGVDLDDEDDEDDR